MYCDHEAPEVARMLVAAHRAGRPIARLPPDLRPGTVDDVYAIQRHVTRSLGPVGGWKVGTSGPAVAPSCAPLYSDRIFSSGVTLDAAWYHALAVEVEFAFRVTTEIPVDPVLEEPEIESRVDLVPLIEVVSSRFLDHRDFTPLEALADGNANGAIIVGAPLAPWPGFGFATCPVTLMIDDAIVQDALNTHPLGDPRRLLHWQVGFCRAMGVSLPVGSIITTGSLQGATPVLTGKKIVGLWHGVPAVTVTFR